MTRFSRTLAYVIAVFVVLTGSAAAQFETRTTFAVHSEPISIAVGDFNRDGNVDVAVATELNHKVAIYLGRGDGTFGPFGYYNVGGAAEVHDIIAADFRRNGILDLAVSADHDDYVNVLLGNGNGTFQPARRSQTPTPPSFIASGDFNHDGRLDLVTIDSSGLCPCISILFGHGDGTFAAPINTEPPNAADALGLGDFNHDGNLDLVTVGQFGGDSEVGVLLGNGDGTFTVGDSYPTGGGPQSVAVGDFNGDGELDLAVAEPLGGQFSIFLGNGDGTFRYGVTLPSFFPSSIQTADFNGDGKLDLVVATGVLSTSLNVYLGNGDGIFTPSMVFPVRDETAPFVGDFNGDGQPDIVLPGILSNTVITVLNTGVVKFSPPTAVNFPFQTVNTVSASQTVTLTNTGSKTLSISSLTAKGEFQMATTCASGLAAGASCDISLSFAPKIVGAKAGTVTINDSASTKPQVIELTGAGTLVSIAPLALSFPPQQVGTSSSPQKITITNGSTTTVNISRIIVSGTNARDFSQSNACGTLTPGASCSISVTFTPKKTGARSAEVDITDDAGGSPQIIPLSGTGT